MMVVWFVGVVCRFVFCGVVGPGVWVVGSNDGS